MKLSAMFGSSSTAVGVAAGGAAVLIAGAVGWQVLRTEPTPAPDGVDTGPEMSEAAPSGAEPGQGLEESAGQTGETGDTTQSPDTPEIAEAPSPDAPSLDVVRVDPEGGTVIAGRAAPNMQVNLFLDGAPLAEVTADTTGNFVALLTLPPSDSPRALSFIGIAPDGGEIPGAEQVLVAPFAGTIEVAEADPAEALPDATAPDAGDTPEPVAIPGEGGDAGTGDAGTGDAGAATQTVLPTPDSPTSDPDADPDTGGVGPTIAAPQTLTNPTLPDTGVSAAPSALSDARPSSAPPAAAAPAVIVAGPDGVRVAQGVPQPAVQTAVQLDAISYDAEGAVTLAGRGPATADIQVYLNNQPIQLGEIGAGGDWSLQLPDVDPGTYTLTVAELAEDGSVESAVETPFLREDPERVASTPMLVDAGVDVITVQPGFTLWGIADANFGDGILYVQIFEENSDQIRDPDWIFPGQIFRLPDMPRSPAEN